MENQGYKKLIEVFGGVAPLARKLGITYWAVQKWGNSRIPSDRLTQLEELSGGRITREEMRPDLYK